MKEQDIQAKIIKHFEAQGAMVVKLVKTNKNGIPDLMVLQEGVTKFIEVKTEKGVLSELQKYRIKELKEKGFEAVVWTGINKEFKK